MCNTSLQQINNYNIYNISSTYEFYVGGCLYSSFIYQFIIVIIVFLLVRHILGCGIFAYPQFILDLGMPLPWFFIVTGLFIVNYIDIIIFECYPEWLPSKTCWPSMGYLSLVQENPPDFFSVGLGRYCCWCGIHCTFVGLF